MSNIIAATEAIKAILVLMHGYGTCAEDFMPIANFIAQKIKCVEIHVLDGYEEAHSARQRKWFNLESGNPENWKRDIQPAGEKMQKYIQDALKRYPELTKKNVIISGFSQGAMMALHVGLKESLGGIIAFSGVLVDDSVVKQNDGSTKVLLIHVDKDDVIKLSEMEQSCQALFRSNIKYEKHVEPNIEHAINLNCLIKTNEFINEIIQNQK